MAESSEFPDSLNVLKRLLLFTIYHLPFTNYESYLEQRNTRGEQRHGGR